MMKATGRQQHFSLIGFVPSPMEMKVRDSIRLLYTNMPGVNVDGVSARMEFECKKDGFRTKVKVHLTIMTGKSPNMVLSCDVPTAMALMDMYGLRHPFDMLGLECTLLSRDYKKSYEILRTRTQSIAS